LPLLVGLGGALAVALGGGFGIAAAGVDGGAGGKGGNGAWLLGNGGDGGNAGARGVGGTPTRLAALGGAGGNAGLWGTHGVVGKFSPGGPSGVYSSFGVSGSSIVNRDGQSVILHGTNVPNIVGYTIMNEPWAGTTWASALLGDPFFDQQKLMPFYNQVASAIRSVEATAPILYGGASATAFGFPSSLGTVTQPGTVYSFHVYCLADFICKPEVAVRYGHVADYSTKKADGTGSFAAGSKTTIAVPQNNFPKGYTVSVTGGTVVSAPNAPTLQIASDAGAATVKVTVTPVA